jgi:hypothetical protein
MVHPEKIEVTRIQKFERRYLKAASLVLQSIAKVARAGRTGEPSKIERERARHYALMRSLPR